MGLFDYFRERYAIWNPLKNVKLGDSVKLEYVNPVEMK